MPFIKKIHKKTKKGRKTYFYLARNYREGPKIKQEILRSLTPEEAQELQEGISLVSPSGETVKTPTLELEQLRIENALLLQISQEIETEKRQLEKQLVNSTSKEAGLQFASKKAPIRSSPSTAKRTARRKGKRKTQKITLKQFF